MSINVTHVHSAHTHIQRHTYVQREREGGGGGGLFVFSFQGQARLILIQTTETVPPPLLFKFYLQVKNFYIYRKTPGAHNMTQHALKGSPPLFTLPIAKIHLPIDALCTPCSRYNLQLCGFCCYKGSYFQRYNSCGGSSLSNGLKINVVLHTLVVTILALLTVRILPPSAVNSRKAADPRGPIGTPTSKKIAVYEEIHFLLNAHC